MLFAKFGWNWPSDFCKEDENLKSLQTDRLMTDNRWSEKLCWAFSLGELRIRYYKSQAYVKLGSAVYHSHALYHWAMMIYNQFDRYEVEQFHKIYWYSNYHLVMLSQHCWLMKSITLHIYLPCSRATLVLSDLKLNCWQWKATVWLEGLENAFFILKQISYVLVFH